MAGDDVVRVVIADDNDGLRVLLNEVVAGDPRLEVVGEAADGRRTLEVVAEARPHVLLLDLGMPTVDGLQVIQALRDSHPDVKVVVYSGFAANGVRAAALELGAVDYLLKGVDPDVIVERLVAACA